MAFGAAHAIQRKIHETDADVPSPGTDGVSSLRFSPNANILVASNWDSTVSCWEVQESAGRVQAIAKAQVKHDGNKPVLDTFWSPDGSTVFSGGADNAVRMWSLGGAAPANGIAQQIGVHDAPVKSVGFCETSKLVVSGGWDRKLKFWDIRSPTPVGAFDLPERCYAMDVKGNLLVVGTAGKHVLCYDLSGAQPREYSRKESPLKYQTRCISCFPDSTGYAVGSIEGRVGIQYVTKVPGKENFAFKCHRQDNNVYAVNAIPFQNQYGTFATVGSDGVVNFWDKDNKQRLKGFSTLERTIPAADFNFQGNLFAYASSYDWSKGCQHVQQGNEIFVHVVLDDEIRPKNKKSSSFKR